jgi:hypothetical protein
MQKKISFSSKLINEKLSASAEASKFLNRFGSKTKVGSPFDKASKEVDKIAAGVHRDTTSVAGRMKGAGLPTSKESYKAPPKPDTVDMMSPYANKAYQTARSGGDNGRYDAATNLERPSIWRNQEKQAGGQGAHDYNVAKHSAPVAPKAKTDPIASQEPQGAGSDPIASKSSSTADPVKEKPAESSVPPVLAGKDNAAKFNRRSTGGGTAKKPVVGEPEEKDPNIPPPPPAAAPPLPKPPTAPPPHPKE